MAKAADEDMRYALASRAHSANAGLCNIAIECERANYTPWCMCGAQPGASYHAGALQGVYAWSCFHSRERCAVCDGAATEAASTQKHSKEGGSREALGHPRKS